MLSRIIPSSICLQKLISSRRNILLKDLLLPLHFLTFDKYSQQNAYYLTCTAQCWLAVRLELAGTLIIFFACLSAVLQHLSQAGNEKFAGLAGLSISFALSVTQSLNWTVRMASDLEASFIAVERVNQYTNETTGVPQEASRETNVDANAGSDWPRNGHIVFKGVSLRYRENLPRVLKKIDLDIPPGSKVGVVGRTGSGKVRPLLHVVELLSHFLHVNLTRCPEYSKLYLSPFSPDKRHPEHACCGAPTSC